jgi:hypothetical protein
MGMQPHTSHHHGNAHLEGCLQAWRQQIQGWAADGSLVPAAVHALGLGEAPAGLHALAGELAAGQCGGLPAVELLGDEELPGTSGHYSDSQKTAFLNSHWLGTATEEQVLEELTRLLGEHLDVIFNTSDTPGDEGRHFQELLSAGPATPPS